MSRLTIGHGNDKLPVMAEIIILFAIVAATAFVGAYASRFQETTLQLGQELAPDNNLLPTGFQDVLTPISQTFRNVAWFGLLLILLVYALVVFSWYISLLAVAGTFLVSGLIRAFIPPGSGHFRRNIEGHLRKQRALHESRGDGEKAASVDFILKRLEQLK